MSLLSEHTKEMMDGRGGLMIGPNRYMLIRPDALMGLFARLEPGDRLLALEAFSASVSEHGGKSAASYAGVGRSEAKRLMSAITAIAPQLGWGKWTLDLKPVVLDLSVKNSPFVEGFGPSEHPVCAPICGMLAAISEQIFGASVLVTESQCASVFKKDRKPAKVCNFSAILDMNVKNN